MEDKVYFSTCSQQGIIYQNGKIVLSVNFLNILKFMFWKYSVFGIKLETYGTRVSAELGLACSFHLEGLQWLNNYDTLQTNDTSRCIELLWFYNGTNQQYGFPMLSDNNVCMFYRPSNPNVDLKLSFWNMDGNFQNWSNTNDWPAMIFSITGIKKYKDPAYRVPRLIKQHSMRFVLKTSQATIMDYGTINNVPNQPIGLIYKWNNYNMAQMMGEM